ncbi:hypothetical protein [Flavobacterium sp. HNIBRBA15423]|uniref:hypothetical protein n=1 Tax=Flavobacterium sp. HNIBRBA15423 TaxID=3458683 RepID=UPI004044069F
MKSLANIQLDEQTLTTIQNMAACNFSPGEIALQLGVKKSLYLKFHNNLDSDIRQAYEAGKLSTTLAIMTKQKELAEGGNITAAQIFLKESERIEFENKKNHCFFGENE